MRANEIMLGDWLRVRYKHFETSEEIIKDFRVTELTTLDKRADSVVYAWGKCDDGQYTRNMGRVEQPEPIPITPEILEKNGKEITV